MYASVITIGDELLIGKVINTNSAWIAQQLNENGIIVYEMLSIPDNKQKIIDTLNFVLSKYDICIITGGLGPTSDDVTKPALCEIFETELEFNEDVLNQIKTFLAARNGILNQLNISQAYIPKNCKILPNSIGTAPGMWFEKNGKTCIALPGVPFEMEKMMLEQVLPSLQEKYNIKNIYHKTILTTGIAESRLAEIIANWEQEVSENIKVAYLPSAGIVKIRLSVYHNAKGRDIILAAETKLLPLISEYIFGFDNDTLELIIAKYLIENNKTLCTAESCTGGNIGYAITSVPGASKYFKGGIIAYSNEIKIQELNIEPLLIEKHGAVSKEVVEAMALNVRKKFDTDYAIAVSGIAGPDGGTPEKPVGTVWIAIASKYRIDSEKFIFGDNRIRNIQRTTIASLNKLRKVLLKEI